MPRTHDGEPAKAVSKAESNLRIVSKTKVKVIERVGVTLKNLLVRNNPWSGQNCPRSDCLPCASDKDKGYSCSRRSATYKTSCKLCLAQGRKVDYIGETSNSLHERAAQHLKAKSKDKEGHMFNHIQEAHPGG